MTAWTSAAPTTVSAHTSTCAAPQRAPVSATVRRVSPWEPALTLSQEERKAMGGTGGHGCHSEDVDMGDTGMAGGAPAPATACAVCARDAAAAAIAAQTRSAAGSGAGDVRAAAAATMSAAELAPCTFCEQPACDACLFTCDGCRLPFCSFCSTLKCVRAPVAAAGVSSRAHARVTLVRPFTVAPHRPHSPRCRCRDHTPSSVCASYDERLERRFCLACERDAAACCDGAGGCPADRDLDMA